LKITRILIVSLNYLKAFQRFTSYINWLSIKKTVHCNKCGQNSSSGRLSTKFAKSNYFFGDEETDFESKYPDHKHMAPVYS
jgi:hypothetical protein